MLFQINSMWQLLGWVLVFAGLVILNEIERRTKLGGYGIFVGVLAILTVYFIAIQISAANGGWGATNDTYVYMGGWFHYAKLYAAAFGCIGFMFLKYKQWIGKTNWFKVWPFVIVAINIMIAVASDFESAIKGAGTCITTTDNQDILALAVDQFIACSSFSKILPNIPPPFG